jgi:hypothetical protein
MDELKRCQCGGKAELKQCHHIRFPGGDCYPFKVVCCDCKIQTITYDTAEEAITVWNRRSDGWIPVAERLPEESGIYMIFGHTKYEKTGDIDTAHFWKERNEWANDWHYEPIVTHWMPPPQPPQPPKKGE